MSMNDSLAAALSKIDNAEKTTKMEVEIAPASATLKKVLDILKDKLYVADYEVVETAQGQTIKLNLLSNINKVGVIKPRSSFKFEDIENVGKRYLPAKGFGIVIVTTPQGMMTLEEAREKHIGGKLVAFCY